MRYLTFRKYQLSFAFLSLLVLAIVGPIAIALTYWATRTVNFGVDEPLSIASFPTTFTTHPGENKTLNMTIINSANINYSVRLSFALNNTSFQEQYATFSNFTYTIRPGVNDLIAWVKIDKKASPAALSMTVQFSRE